MTRLTKYLGPYIYIRSVHISLPPPPSTLVILGFSAITEPSVAVSSVGEDKWVVWHVHMHKALLLHLFNQQPPPSPVYTLVEDNVGCK